MATDAKRMTFESFFVGPSNVGAFLLVREFCANSVLQPFLIMGRSGNGKTHLLRAVESELRRSVPDSKVGFVSVGVGNALNFPDLGHGGTLLIDDLSGSIRDLSAMDTIAKHVTGTLKSEGKVLIATHAYGPFELIVHDWMATFWAKARIEKIAAPELSLKLSHAAFMAKEMNLDLSASELTSLAENRPSFREVEGDLIFLDACKKLRHSQDP